MLNNSYLYFWRTTLVLSLLAPQNQFQEGLDRIFPQV